MTELFPTSPFAKGASAELFDIGNGQVLKRFRSSVSDAMIEREALASLHAHACGILTAPALGHWKEQGQRGILYPRLEGAALLDWIRQHPLRAGWALDVMGHIQANMHQASGGELRSLKQVLATDIAYGPVPKALQQAAIAYLDSLPDGTALTHGDYHLGNVMMDGQNMIVIDWSKAAMGHPAADLVRSEMLMRFGRGPQDMITNIWRDWAAKRLCRSYYKATDDICARDLDRWRPIIALAWLRARDAGRNAAFHRYINRALTQMGLPLLAN